VAFRILPGIPSAISMANKQLKRPFYLAAGVAIGVVIGLVIGNVVMGIGIGIAIGIATSLASKGSGD
jgi:hypothetical protein